MKMTYPSISEGKGWTSSRAFIDGIQEQIKIKVFPPYIPEGENDASELLVGVRVDDDEVKTVIKIKIWKDENNVYTKHEDLETALNIEATEEREEVDGDVSAMNKRRNKRDGSQVSVESLKRFAENLENKNKRKGKVCTYYKCKSL